MVDPEDPLVRWATFGRQVELFLQGDIGSYLIKKARQEADDATQELIKSDPFKPEKIMELQNRIKVSDSIMTWLGDAIAAGESALEQLKEEKGQ